MHGGICLALLVGAVCADYPIIQDYVGFQKGLYSHRPSQTFRSANITSPIFNYVTWRKDLIAGNQYSHIFLDLRFRDGGPYIIRDDDLSLVYADLSFQTVMNTRVQNIRGKDHLSFWHGSKFSGRGNGFCVFYDNQYRIKFNVTVQGSRVRADFHECQVTPDGNVILTAYEDKPYNLTSLGIPDYHTLADSCFQEVDIESNELKFAWCASDHFPPDITYQTYARKRDGTSNSPENNNNNEDNGDNLTEGLDVYHINSIQKTHEGHYLASLRAAKLIVYINGTSGEPIWNLGGKANNFTDITSLDILASNPGSDGALSFGWQHVARFIDDSLTRVSLFDNHNVSTNTGCIDDTCSRGRILQIDTTDPQNLTVELVQDYRSPQGLTSQVMGSIQLLDSPTGSQNVFIGWGSNSEFTEHTINGTLVRDVQFSPLDPRHAFHGMPGVNSYRIFKHQWHGYPEWAPSVAVDEDGTLFVSWNGATEVKDWAVHGSYEKEDLGSIKGSGYGFDLAHEPLRRRKPIHVVKRAGFETEISIDYFSMPYLKVAALNFMGVVIGTSDLIEIVPPLECGLDCIGLQSILFP